MTALLLESIITMGKDIRKAAITLDKKEVRFLVDSYYERQDERIRSAGRERALDKDGEPNAIVSWLTDQAETLENQIKGALEKYAKSDPTGEWAMSQWGIGPVITYKQDGKFNKVISRRWYDNEERKAMMFEQNIEQQLDDNIRF